MDMNALLNAVASGPAPVPGGVQQVPIPKITLPGIGQVPVPDVPKPPAPPVVPGQPLPGGPGNPYAPGGPGNPYGTTPAVAAKLGNMIPAAAGGAGNIIGQAGPASIYQPTAAGTMQVAGPKDDRIMVANMPTSTAAMLGNRVGGSPGLNALANAVTAGGGHLGTGMLGQAAQAATPMQQPIPQQNAQLMHIANQLAQPPASAAAAPTRAPLTIAPIAQPFGQHVAPKARSTLIGPGAARRNA